MSTFPDPPNYINQLSDSSGNINHQGILSSNISGSTILNSTFPTTSTGDSLGHYHYTEAGSNALQFLNCSGTGSGGHKFYTSNSTTAPINTAIFDSSGFTIDKSTGGSPVLVNLPNITISTPTAVVFATPINQPPWNIVGLGNPVQVLQNTVNMVTGVTYYLTAFSTQLGQIATNPDGTGIIDCTDLTSLPQPILAWENGQFTPSTIQTINLFENMTITTDLNNSVLNASSLTFNNINVKMNQVQPTLIYSSPLIYADGHAPATSLTIRNTYGYSGWYFKNTNSGPNKINWYFPPNKLNNTLVSDVKGISISFFNGVTTSNDNSLFITILTVPTGVNDFAPGFFHSSNTYVFNQSIQPTANANYQGVCIIDINDIPYNYETQIQFQQSTVNNPRGIYAQTDKILAVVIGSNSASPINSVEFVVNKLNLHYADFTQSYLLISP